jgi:hypothetical protein
MALAAAKAAGIDLSELLAEALRRRLLIWALLNESRPRSGGTKQQNGSGRQQWND